MPSMRKQMMIILHMGLGVVRLTELHSYIPIGEKCAFPGHAVAAAGADQLDRNGMPPTSLQNL